jgi:hypothetical protein
VQAAARDMGLQVQVLGAGTSGEIGGLTSYGARLTDARRSRSLVPSTRARACARPSSVVFDNT